ncbi:MAG TPA: hypothetical protein VEL79_05520 [Vicinamibacterales bacterium]|nr:hypothetical protein [Vicinamibacterales bacterium]
MPPAQAVWGLVVLAFLIVVIVSARRKRRRGGTRAFGAGPGAMGAVYGLLNEDKRNAIEMIVEEKAESRDPEDAEGNLPDLEKPRK